MQVDIEGKLDMLNYLKVIKSIESYNYSVKDRKDLNRDD